MIRQAARWLEERTGLGTSIRDFLNEEIPGSSGWHQVFGSVCVFLFSTQAFTGILLAFNFAPTASEAYHSLKYILREVAGGRMVRGLHHWGASMMVVAVVLHMAQVFLYGAYKKPREATWMAGVVLLLITLAFGLTGYLLPWDNRAYWGTVVTTQIAGGAPVVGGLLLRLMGAEDGVGAVTFSRFYSLHTVVLPLVSILLIIFHIRLVRRHGAAPAAVEDRPKSRFFPQQAFRDTAAVFAAFAILFVMAAALEAPLEQIADPTDTNYIPRPEWYFLFLFQTLKLFKGASEAIGGVLLPAAAVAVLFAVPFLDRGRVRRLAQRTAAIVVLFAAATAWVSLTAAAVLSSPRSSHAAAAQATDSAWLRMSPEELAGVGYFRQARCSGCHNLVDGEPKPGPNLASFGGTKSTGDILSHLKNAGRQVAMPRIELSTVQLQALSAFLTNLNPQNAEAFSGAPPEAVSGAQVFVSTGCGSCHTVNGAGGTIGPPLNGLAGRRTRDWVAQHLRDPRSQTPATSMPPFTFSDRDRDHLLAYLFALLGG